MESASVAAQTVEQEQEPEPEIPARTRDAAWHLDVERNRTVDVRVQRVSELLLDGERMCANVAARAIAKRR